MAMAEERKIDGPFREIKLSKRYWDEQALLVPIDAETGQPLDYVKDVRIDEREDSVSLLHISFLVVKEMFE